MLQTERHICCILVLFLMVYGVNCYEKNLRKIVRNQSKMVPRPFSDVRNADMAWQKPSRTSGLVLSGIVKKTVDKQKGPRVSKFISTDRGKAEVKFAPFIASDSRLTDPPPDKSVSHYSPEDNLYFPYQRDDNSNLTNDIAIQNFYQVVEPTRSQAEAAIKEIVPLYPQNRNQQKHWYIPNSKVVAKATPITNILTKIRPVTGSERNEYQEHLIPIVNETSTFTYSLSNRSNSYTCIKKTQADIDAQQTFLELDVEPPWMPAKTYWRSIFESRYASLMRSTKWPSLNVILVPRTHVDTIWKESFEQIHNHTAHKILTNVVKKLKYFKNLTFTWNEVSHLSEWWKTTTNKNRLIFRRLCRSKRLEITTGGWVEPDEATTHVFGLLHQLIEGHQWLKTHLNYSPKVAWVSGNVAHSSTMPYLLSSCGLLSLIFTNLHYSWEQHIADYQLSDFIWLQSWANKRVPTSLNNLLHKLGADRLPMHSVLTHFLPFNSAGFVGCGPNGSVCENEFDFSGKHDLSDIHGYNVKKKAESLLEQYSKTGSMTPHNVIIASLGDNDHYRSESEFDYQYMNYKKIADFVNANSQIYKANIKFGTPKDYFKVVTEKKKDFPTLTGDFMNFADIRSGTPAYWAGYFTTRPLIKIWLRRLEATLRSSEILLSFAVNLGVLDRGSVRELHIILSGARVTAARLTDRHISSGTLPSGIVSHVKNLILQAVRDCWRVQEHAASFLTTRSNNKKPYLQKYVHREGEFASIFRSITAGDKLYLFNSLSQERTEIVDLITRTPNIRITDHSNKEETIQVNPMWSYTSKNVIDISQAFYKITFIVVVPPMTFKLLKVLSSNDGSSQLATVYCSACPSKAKSQNPFFIIQPIQPGDIQLESFKLRLSFDENSGFLKKVVEKQSNIEKHIVVNYMAFRSSNVNSGMFLFNTNVSRPIEEVLLPFTTGEKKQHIIIISGPVSTELTTIYGNFVHSTIKILNLIKGHLSNTIYLETKLDYEQSPKNREVELFLFIQTDIANGIHPEIYTDNNGFQYSQRVLNISRRIESNIYPTTSMVFLQDNKSRMTLITDHAQAVTSLKEGQLSLVLDRRVLFNDQRGVDEELSDYSKTVHRHYLLLENFSSQYKKVDTAHDVQLPSLAAIHLANMLNYPLDSFIFEKNDTNDRNCFGDLHLIKSSFPCEVNVVNYRYEGPKHKLTTETVGESALLVLHRHSYSCQFGDTWTDFCSTDSDFTLKEIFHKLNRTLQTNLCGTSKGIDVLTLDKNNLSPMEMVTLQIYFNN